MRFKPVPLPPADRSTVETVREALPADADGVDDCCGRLVDRTSIATREEARSWIAFLRALELATADGAGYRRTSREFDRSGVRAAFRERVYGADAILEILDRAEGPIPAATVHERLCDERSSIERRSSAGSTDSEERVHRLLEWAILFGLAERAEGGYRLR